MGKGLVRICPLCGEHLEGIKTDWVLVERTINRHQVCTIGTSWNASPQIERAVDSQIASNLAAYKLDYDAELNLGWYGTAWVQCPDVRNEITEVTFPC